MTRLAALLLIMLMPAGASAQLMAWAGPDLTPVIQGVPSQLLTEDAAMTPVTPTLVSGEGTWALTGAPTGLSINASTGQISGTPTTAGNSIATATCTNDQAVADHVLIPFAVAAAAVTINAGWLADSDNYVTESGRVIYVLNLANTTYTLDVDVTTDGTAFYIANTDITLDLNGHTITYNTDGIGSSVEGEPWTAPHGIWLLYNSAEVALGAKYGADAHDFIACNGSIVCDTAGALAHAIYAYNHTNACYEGLLIEADGKDTHTLFSQGSTGFTALNCHLKTLQATTFNRHAGPANVRLKGELHIERCFLEGGNQGVNIPESADDTVIYKNVFANHAYDATNPYCVGFIGAPILIDENIMVPWDGRGVITSDDQFGTKTITDNLIFHREEANTEFGTSLNAPAIRIRLASDDTQFLRNTTLGIGGGAVTVQDGGYCAASGLYLSNTGGGTVNVMQNNHMTVILTGTPDATHYVHPVTTEGQGTRGTPLGPGEDIITNNTFRSNHLMYGMIGYDGGTQQSVPIANNTWEWCTGATAHDEFFAAVDAKLPTLGLTTAINTLADTYIGLLDTDVDTLIGSQGLQTNKYFAYVGPYDVEQFVDFLNNTYGAGVDPEDYSETGVTTAGAVLMREGFTQSVQLLNGVTPIANTVVAVVSDAGDSYSVTTDSGGNAELIFYRFALERAEPEDSPFAIVPRTEIDITPTGYGVETITNASIPATKGFTPE